MKTTVKAPAKTTAPAAKAKAAPAKGKAAAKAAPAKAAAPKKASAPRPSYGDKKITVLSKANPYREGSKRSASFEALLKSKNVAEYVAKGGKMKYIGRWVAADIIKLA